MAGTSGPIAGRRYLMKISVDAGVMNLIMDV
jgi:hypothetical protein